MSFRNLVLTLLGICLLSLVVFYVVNYVKIDLKVKSNANISRDKPNSNSPKIAIDSTDTPHVMWESVSGSSGHESRETEYVKWDGVNWVDEKGDKHKSNTKLDSDDLNIGTVSDIIIEENDTIHVLADGKMIAYLKLEDGKWKSIEGDVYTRTSWTGNIFSGGRPSLELDKNGFPVVASESVVSANVDKSFLLFTRWNGLDWESHQDIPYNKRMMIDTAYHDSYFVKLALDFDDTPYLLWRYEFSDANYICLIKKDGNNWTNIYGEEFLPKRNNASLVRSGLFVWPGDMKTDSKGNLHILFYDVVDDEIVVPTYVIFDGEELKYLDGEIYDPGNLRKTSVIGSEVIFSEYTFELDSNDFPHVVWEDINEELESKDIYYAKWDGSNWVTAAGSSVSDSSDLNVSQNARNSYLPAVALDSNDRPHIVWTEGSSWGSGDNDVLYVRWNGESWVSASGKPYKPSRYRGR